jgi:hypothetical protein
MLTFINLFHYNAEMHISSKYTQNLYQITHMTLSQANLNTLERIIIIQMKFIPQKS